MYLGYLTNSDSAVVVHTHSLRQSNSQSPLQLWVVMWVDELKSWHGESSASGASL